MMQDEPMEQAETFRPFPRGALIAGFTLIAFVIVGAGTAKLTGIGQVRAPAFEPVETRSLTFADEPRGVIHVRDAETGATVRTLKAIEGGFVRVVMRSMAHARKIRAIGAEPPFVLMRDATGKLAIKDPSTGQSIRLGAFGKDNMDAFATLLDREDRSASR